MRTTDSVEAVRDWVATARAASKRIGCVPTMGALHRGHTSLIEASIAGNDRTVVTIFVNAPQFNDAGDFDGYPRPLEQDLEICQDLGVDLVFAPEDVTMYPAGHATSVDVGPLGDVLEGEFRPGHFRGVATVVVSLLNIVLPDAAFFGRKDYQQQLVIQQVCRDLQLPVEIVTCPTIRDNDGLALSSRNVLLNPEQRRVATVLHGALSRARERFRQSPDATPEDLAAASGVLQEGLRAAPGLELEYACIVDARTLQSPVILQPPLPPLIGLVAGTVGGIRLIDNLLFSFASH
tara:strand:+ start:1390 stop:2265 length:876 start_codon:yes stop_codon:yes gene_type:complete